MTQEKAPQHIRVEQNQEKAVGCDAPFYVLRAGKGKAPIVV
jgi:hypothetical protein